jgi:hypothetical protein
VIRKRPAGPSTRDDLVAKLRKIHRPTGGQCHECSRPYPCRTIRLTLGEPASTGPLPQLPGVLP